MKRENDLESGLLKQKSIKGIKKELNKEQDENENNEDTKKVNLTTSLLVHKLVSLLYSNLQY